MNKGRIGNLLSHTCILSSCACTLVSRLNAYTNGLLPSLKNTFFFLSFGEEGLQLCYLERWRSLCIFAWSLPDLSALLVSVHLIYPCASRTRLWWAGKPRAWSSEPAGTPPHPTHIHLQSWFVPWHPFPYHLRVKGLLPLSAANLPPTRNPSRCWRKVWLGSCDSLIGTDFISRISNAAINPERQLFHVKAHSYCRSGSDNVYILWKKKIFFKCVSYFKINLPQMQYHFQEANHSFIIVL